MSTAPLLIRLDVVEVGHVLHLLVSSAAGHHETYEFSDRQALMTYHARCEAHLQAQGYTLAATVHERRGGPDRRRSTSADQRRPPVGSR